MITEDLTQIPKCLEAARSSYLINRTKSLTFRRHQLQQLLKGLEELKPQFDQALKEDLGANEFYSFAFSMQISINEVKHTLENFEKWSKPVKKETPLLIGPASSMLIPEPYGTCLVMSAWNYPVYTSIPPMAQAMAAGNCVILKPSEMAPHTSNVLKKLVESYLDKGCYFCIEGGYQVCESLLKNPFDLIIFTGSSEKGKLVAKAAAEFLTPCILELGGKSPTIVDSDANLQNAALRVVQGRFVNAGQTCIACDYVFVHQKVKDQFIALMKEKIVQFFGQDPSQNPEYIKIITPAHTQRLGKLLENTGGNIIHGGNFNAENRYFQPTLLENPNPDSQVMKEEIFGPILPIYSFTSIQEVISFIKQRPKPLALYYFGKQHKDKIISETSSGSVAVNEALYQILNPDLPFGGVGHSGLGQYHGKYGFDACSHYKPVLQKTTFNFWPYSARYPPFTQSKQNLMKIFLTKANFYESKMYKLLVIFAILTVGGTAAHKNQAQITNGINALKPILSEQFKKFSRL